MSKKPNKELWNKLSKYQKKLWLVLNYKFSLAEYLSGIFKVSPSDKEIKVMAHNLAFVAVWTIGDGVRFKCPVHADYRCFCDPRKNDSKNKRSK